MVTLKLDWDGEEDKEFEKKLKTILRIYELKEANIIKYKTCHGYHLYIKLNANLSNMEVICLQSLLCSDSWRELYNLERIKKGWIEDWNVLFRLKKKDGKIVSKEKFIEEKKVEI